METGKMDYLRDIDVSKLEYYIKACNYGRGGLFLDAIKDYSIDDFTEAQLKQLYRTVIDLPVMAKISPTETIEYAHPYVPATIMKYFRLSASKLRDSSEIKRIPTLKAVCEEYGAENVDSVLNSEMAYYELRNYDYPLEGASDFKMREMRKAYEDCIDLLEYIPGLNAVTHGQMNHIRKILAVYPDMLFHPAAHLYDEDQLEMIFRCVCDQNCRDKIIPRISDVTLSPAQMRFIYEGHRLYDGHLDKQTISRSFPYTYRDVDMKKYSDEQLGLIIEVLKMNTHGDHYADAFVAMLTGKTVREMVKLYNDTVMNNPFIAAKLITYETKVDMVSVVQEQSVT